MNTKSSESMSYLSAYAEDGGKYENIEKVSWGEGLIMLIFYLRGEKILYLIKK